MGDEKKGLFLAELIRQRSALAARAQQLTRNGADAADLVQDTIEHALRASRHFVAGTNMRAWLRRIMHNLFMDRCRSRAHLRAFNPLEMESLTADEPRAPRLSDLIPESAIEAAISDLKPFQQEIFRLAYDHQLSHRAIAERLKIPVATAGVRLWRARTKLRNVLEAKWGWVLPEQQVWPAFRRRQAAPANDIFVDLPSVGSRRRARAGRRTSAVGSREAARALR